MKPWFRVTSAKLQKVLVHQIYGISNASRKPASAGEGISKYQLNK